MTNEQQAQEIREYLAGHGITAQTGSLDRAVELITQKPKSFTTTTETIDRDAEKLALEQSVIGLVTQILGVAPTLPFANGDTQTIVDALNAVVDSDSATADQKINALKAGTNLMQLKAALGGDLTYPEFGQAQKLVEHITTVYGQSVAEQRGWTGVIDKNYIRGLY